MFVKSADGKYYPVGSVEYLGTSADGRGTAMLSGGKAVELSDGELDRLLIESGRTLPAAPDTFVLEQIDLRCRPSSYARVPVLGWIIANGRVLPVTIEGVNHGMDRPIPVLMPSGEIVVATECTYADEDCFLNEQKSSTEAS